MSRKIRSGELTSGKAARASVAASARSIAALMQDALRPVRRAGNGGVRSPWSPDRAAGRPALLPAVAGKGCSQGAGPAAVNENARQSGLPCTVAGPYAAAAALTSVTAL